MENTSTDWKALCAAELRGDTTTNQEGYSSHV